MVRPLASPAVPARPRIALVTCAPLPEGDADDCWSAVISWALLGCVLPSLVATDPDEFEPSLFLGHDRGAADRLAGAIADRVRPRVV